MLDSINLYKKIEKSNINVYLYALNFDHWIRHEYYISVVLNSQRTKINSTANVSTLYLFAFRIIITSCKITFRPFFHIFARCFFYCMDQIHTHIHYGHETVKIPTHHFKFTFTKRLYLVFYFWLKACSEITEHFQRTRHG